MSRQRRSRITQVLRALGHSTSTPPDYSFGEAMRYSVNVASSERDRRRAWALAFKVYMEKEYAPPCESQLWYGLHDALPDTTTFLAERRGAAVGALTLVFDSPLGIPADSLYRRELRTLRAGKRRVCEIVSLVSHGLGLREGARVTKHLFKLAYLTARKIEVATDFVITVNPRHVRYYSRVLGFSQVGRERQYDKVGGAPAVLLRLDLTTAAAEYREKHGAARGSLYRFFEDPTTEPQVLRFLRSERRPLSETTLLRYFVHERALLPRARPEHRRLIRNCYPLYDLVPDTSETRELQPV